MISTSSRRTFQAIASGFGMFAMLASLTALTYVHGFRADFSTGTRFTLSDHARQVLRDIAEPIRLTAFIRTEDGRNPVIKDLLWQARNQSDKLSYEIVDVNKNPARATRVGVTAYGAVVVETATRRRDFTNPTETQLISAILNVTRPPKRIGVITGHGECALGDVNRRTGCSQLRTAVSQESYRIDELSLATSDIIADEIDVVLINGPKSDFLDPELKALRSYLDAGGKLVVLLDPYAASRLTALLLKYGVVMGEDVVLDPQNRLADGEAISAVLPDVNRSHLVAATLKSPPMFSGMRSVAGRGVGEVAKRVVVDLVRSGPRSWAGHDPAILDGAAPKFVAGRDLNGPFSVALEVSQPANDGAAAVRGTTTRIVAVGDADFASNRFFDYLGNKDLLLNTINWLVRDERLIGNRPEAQPGGSKVLFISQAQVVGLFWWCVLIIPAMYLAVGIAVLAWRRVGP